MPGISKRYPDHEIDPDNIWTKIDRDMARPRYFFHVLIMLKATDTDDQQLDIGKYCFEYVTNMLLTVQS